VSQGLDRQEDDRWKRLGDWLRTIDPDRRMVNEFFAELL
jgi:hypothetical protein